MSDEPRSRAATLATWAAVLLAAVVVVAFFAGWGARLQPLRVQGPRLLIFAGVLLTAWSLARGLRSRLDLGPVSGLLASFGLLSMLWGALAILGLLSPWVAWALLAAGAATGVILWRRDPGSLRPCWPTPGRAWPAAVACAVGLALMLPLLFSPPCTMDELVYHLLVPQSWIAANGITAPPNFAHASFPLQVDLLYLWALLLGEPIVAKLIHCALTACGLLIAARCSAKSGGAAAGWATAGLLMTTPVFLTNGSWAVVDGALAAFVLAGCLQLVRLREHGSRAPILTAGLFWGLALATKYTALLYAAVAFPLLLWPFTGGGRKRGALAAGLAALVACPWWIRNAFVHGDPLHPFGAPLLGVDNGVRLAEMTGEEQSAGVLGSLDGLWEDAISRGPADESLGALPLALVALLLVQFGRLSATAKRLLLVALTCAGVLSLGFSGSSRFLLPALLLLSVGAGERLAAWWNRGGLAATGATLLLAACALPNFALVSWQTRELFDPVRVALGYESRDDYLSRTERGHSVLLRAQDRVHHEDRVLALWTTRLFWLDRDVIVTGPADVPWIRDRIRKTDGLEALLDELEREGVTHLLFDAAEFERRITYGPGSADWTERELQVLRELLGRHELVEEHGDRIALYRLR